MGIISKEPSRNIVPTILFASYIVGTRNVPS
jgi:hypothetical protein